MYFEVCSLNPHHRRFLMAPRKKGPRGSSSTVTPALKRARIKIKALESENLELKEEIARVRADAEAKIEEAKNVAAGFKVDFDLVNEKVDSFIGEVRKVSDRNDQLEIENVNLRDTVDNREEEIVEQQCDTILLVRFLRNSLEGKALL